MNRASRSDCYDRSLIITCALTMLTFINFDTVPCKPVPIDAIHICTNIETSIIMIHSKNHDSGMLTYHLLERSPEITENLSNDSFGIQYSGDKSLDTTQVITLNGVPPAKMGESETKHFQQVSMRYLNSTLAQKNNVDILLVKISNQKILKPSDTLNDNNRRLVLSSSLEITTVVTGKHRPPPEIDFSALVTEAVNEDSIELVQELKKPQLIIENDEEIEISYFKHVESVISRTHITISPSLSPTISSLSPTTETIIHPQANGSSTGATIKAVMLFFAIVGCVLSILFASYWIWNSKKKKNVMASYEYYEKDRLSARDTSFYKRASSAKIYRINEEYVDENCESVLNGTMRGMEKAIKDDRRYQDYHNSHSTCATELVSENEDEVRGSLPRSRSSNIHDERHHRANQHNLRSSTSNLRSSRSLKHPSSSLRRSSTSSSRSITSSRRSSTDSRRRSSTSSSRYEFDFENEGRSRRDLPDP